MALGFFEISGVVAALDALDIMLKASNVSLAAWERKWGGRLVTIIITGDVAAVQAALHAAADGIKKPVASGLLANPHSEVQRLVGKSAARVARQEA